MAKKARTADTVEGIVDAMEGEHDELLKVSFLYNNRMYSPELAEELKIDENNLDEEFCNQPKKYGWWATLYALAQEKLEKKEYLLTCKEAEVDQYFRGEGVIEETGDAPYFRQTSIKLTEDALKKAVARHPEVRVLKEEIISARKDAAILKGARDSFDQRKDMLIQLGASSRKEYSTPDLRSLKEKAKEAIKNGKN